MSREVDDRATTDAHARAEVDSPELTAEQAMGLFERMTRIRHFELRVNQLYLSAKMPGLAHLYAGQEAVAVGVCSVLRRDDVITSTHRGHGHCLAKGAAVDRMFAELLGKEAGYCHGKGGSMHIADPETGNLGANAIVAGSAGIATGAAMSAKLQGADRVAACFFGEGALGQGVLYEVMNMASLWKLPVIYVCENNLYNEYTHYRETTAGDVTARAASFGIPTEIVDGQAVMEVRAAAGRAVERARAAGGPTFLECRTYRFFGHHVGDVDRSYYRTKQEEEEWRSSRDPLVVLGAWMRDRGYADEEGLQALDRRVAAEVEEAERFAVDAPYPDPSEVDRHVYP
jgi:pyruvate dehydrogenase E1 component alpha subunit